MEQFPHALLAFDEWCAEDVLSAHMGVKASGISQAALSAQGVTVGVFWQNRAVQQSCSTVIDRGIYVMLGGSLLGFLVS